MTESALRAAELANEYGEAAAARAGSYLAAAWRARDAARVQLWGEVREMLLRSEQPREAAVQASDERRMAK